MKLSVLILFYILLWQLSFSQNLAQKENYNKASLTIKQFSEFIDRFNYEKDPFGNGRDTLEKYISRPEYLEHLFDKYVFTAEKDSVLKNKFITFICDSSIYISHQKTKITAQVKAKVLYSGKPYLITLYLHKKTDKNGVKQWFIFDADLYDLSGVLKDKQTEFIPPNDNELDFLQMSKVLKKEGNAFDIVSPDATVSDLAVFIAFLNSGDLQYEYAESVNYIIEIADTWKITVKQNNGLGLGGGWLINKIKLID